MHHPVEARYIESKELGIASVLAADKHCKAASPEQRVRVTYLTEGAANIICSLHGTAGLDSKLLRLRKGTWSGTGTGPLPGSKRPPPFLSSSMVLEHFSANIAPIFEASQLVQQELITVDAALVEQINAQLDALERLQDRPQERWHWHVQHQERCGLLITSMLPRTPNELLFHFKPKWLLQSPTAPEGSRRCRTCALAARRGTAFEKTVCPLALLSPESADIRTQIKNSARGESTVYFDESSESDLTVERLPNPRDIKRIVDDFLPSGKAHNVLQRLRALQQHYDPHGVLRLDDNEGTENIAMAMTLRDATMFMRLCEDGIDVRLGDLDPKSGDNKHKVKQWMRMERELIDEGWYAGQETCSESSNSIRHESCMLWHAT